LVNQESRRVCLRAELRAGRQAVTVHTREISKAGVVVFGDNIAEVGQRVVLELSLPRHVLPLSFRGIVTDVAGSGGPGDPGTVRVRFERDSDGESRGLSELFQRLDESGHVDGAGAAYRVLIVDDSDILRDLFSYGVRKYFRQTSSPVLVDSAGDGMAAWRMLERENYELVVVDRYLPVLDGARLVERIRTQLDRDIFVVGVSSAGREAAQTMLASGVDLFLPKPIVLRDVFSTLDALTRGNA
jgi:CheY-like chemotaxis protein